MADGRKNNGGHKTAGRKKKADEIRMIERMDATLAPTEVWEALAKKVRDLDVMAIKTWLSYRYGQPKQSVDHTSGGETIKAPPVNWIDTDESAK